MPSYRSAKRGALEEALKPYQGQHYINLYVRNLYINKENVEISDRFELNPLSPLPTTSGETLTFWVSDGRFSSGTLVEASFALGVTVTDCSTEYFEHQVLQGPVLRQIYTWPGFDEQKIIANCKALFGWSIVDLLKQASAQLEIPLEHVLTNGKPMCCETQAELLDSLARWKAISRSKNILGNYEIGDEEGKRAHIEERAGEFFPDFLNRLKNDPNDFGPQIRCVQGLRFQPLLERAKGPIVLTV